MTTRKPHRFDAGLCGLALAMLATPVFAAGNLLNNPSFDHDLAGWTVLGSETASWNQVDAFNDLHSGSAVVGNAKNPSAGSVPLALGQCVSVAPSSDYSFGGRMMVPAGQPENTSAELWAESYASDNCTTGLLLTAQEHVSTTAKWTTRARGFTTLPTVHSVRLTLATWKPEGVTASAATYFDNLYLQEGKGGNGFVIGPSAAGSWYDPAQSGHGVLLEMLNQVHAWMCWFTFDLGGNRAWICAEGSAGSNAIDFAEAFVVDGGKFPPLFNPQAIAEVPWGSITVTFTGCNNATMAWSTTAPGFQSGSMPLSRLTSLWGIACQ
jgi:hypothetical protein